MSILLIIIFIVAIILPWYRSLGNEYLYFLSCKFSNKKLARLITYSKKKKIFNYIYNDIRINDKSFENLKILLQEYFFITEMNPLDLIDTQWRTSKNLYYNIYADFIFTYCRTTTNERFRNVDKDIMDFFISNNLPVIESFEFITGNDTNPIFLAILIEIAVLLEIIPTESERDTLHNIGYPIDILSLKLKVEDEYGIL